MNTHESYVSFETAKLLKEAGFNWTCDKNYMGEVGYPLWTATIPGNLNDESKVHKGWKSAPSLAVAQRWLREVKGYHISVFPETTYKEGIMYNFSIYKEDYDFNANHIYTGQTVKTYEEALEEGIKKCLTLLLQK